MLNFYTWHYTILKFQISNLSKDNRKDGRYTRPPLSNAKTYWYEGCYRNWTIKPTVRKTIVPFSRKFWSPFRISEDLSLAAQQHIFVVKHNNEASKFYIANFKNYDIERDIQTLERDIRQQKESSVNAKTAITFDQLKKIHKYWTIP